MDIVLREIDRLNHLIEDFLQFARPQRKELEKFSLNQLILDTLQLFKTVKNDSAIGHRDKIFQ